MGMRNNNAPCSAIKGKAEEEVGKSPPATPTTCTSTSTYTTTPSFSSSSNASLSSYVNGPHNFLSAPPSSSCLGTTRISTPTTPTSVHLHPRRIFKNPLNLHIRTDRNSFFCTSVPPASAPVVPFSSFAPSSTPRIFEPLTPHSPIDLPHHHNATSNRKYNRVTTSSTPIRHGPYSHVSTPNLSNEDSSSAVTNTTATSVTDDCYDEDDYEEYDIDEDPVVATIPQHIDHFKYNSVMNGPSSAPPATVSHTFPFYHSSPQDILFQAIEKIQEFPFVCTDCGKRFKKQVHLKSHTRIHLSKKPFSCEICHQEFLRKHDLRRHERIHGKYRLRRGNPF